MVTHTTFSLAKPSPGFWTWQLGITKPRGVTRHIQQAYCGWIINCSKAELNANGLLDDALKVEEEKRTEPVVIQRCLQISVLSFITVLLTKVGLHKFIYDMTKQLLWLCLFRTRPVCAVAKYCHEVDLRPTFLLRDARIAEVLCISYFFIR